MNKVPKYVWNFVDVTYNHAYNKRNVTYNALCYVFRYFVYTCMSHILFSFISLKIYNNIKYYAYWVKILHILYPKISTPEKALTIEIANEWKSVFTKWGKLRTWICHPSFLIISRSCNVALILNVLLEWNLIPFDSIKDLTELILG